ncbi:SDR family NAD(P)-dependent oxidoreductase [Promicromonospora citrea]|uniref:Short-chain dehydrogenase n=1 Tax=Promicromonospora citrea TaxID=43677 RepID=A0A8H9L660_9MICO|nr:SDR family oxidoreductase [Promicromonospora citrea]NNH51027.1 SDR family oxidoreductase [Promicromonospora citrea]GGM29671.1 short-chain dehydrogenase [Promicromonospora citrea]HEV6954640.1 SDR family oxidoreductase [Promicromonospora sp.]
MSTKTAFITGGTSGIGKATAELLHARGWRVMVTGVTHVGDADLPDGVRAVRADLASLSDIDAAAEQAREHLGSIGLLFLNAAAFRSGPFESTSEEDFDVVFDVNVKGSFFTLQRTLPLLGEGSSVVFTVGAGEGTGAAMMAAKNSLLPLMRSLALELAPRGIRVNAVSPGVIDTPVYSRMGMAPEALAAWGAEVPLGRVGTTTDVAEAVAYLASDAAGYVTGEDLVVSGGMGVHPRTA